MKKIIKPFSILENHKQNTTMPIALISLAHEEKRRRILVENGIPASWVENYFQGADFRNSQHKIDNVANINMMQEVKGGEVFPGEIGCALSHKRVAEWLANSSFNLMLVLEDDVIPLPSNFEDQVIQIAESFQPVAKDGLSFIVHLGLPEQMAKNTLARRVYFLSHFQNKERPSIYMYIGSERTIWYAHAYLISKQAAINTLNIEKKLLTLADDWVARRNMGLIDSIFFCYPRLFYQNEQIPSCIGSRSDSPGTAQKLATNPLPLRIYHTITRGFFYGKLRERLVSTLPVFLK
jgi:GR25 family glycosyltransferase involved in LPS biosynthesis